MPKFFRGIRIQSLELGKVKNYLLYAVGEIILVVAGILIAVKVGDINEQKKKEQEFKVALKVLESDLLTDIASVNEALEYWRRADSISIKILNNDITKEDLVADSLLFIRPIIYRRDVAFHYNGYSTINKMLESKPMGYDDILESLSSLMSGVVPGVDNIQANLQDVTTEYRVFVRDNQTWNWLRYTNFALWVEKDYHYCPTKILKERLV